MTALAAACRCSNCQKTIAPAKVQRVEIEIPGKAAEAFDLCVRCARRLARNVVRLERAQGLRGVLQA